jgi:cytochrome c-type biogenesis protein CcmH
VNALTLVSLMALAAVSSSAQDATPASPEAGGVSVQAAVGAPRGRPLTGKALEIETRRVTELLRCPVCQGLSVAASPTGMALKMRDQVREMLASGYDDEQVLSYFEASYGEFVRLRPPLRGVNWLVWVAPVLGLLVGIAIVTRSLRAPRTGRGPEVAASPSPATPGPDALPADPELAAYVRRVRELAYGWPGGSRPVADGDAATAPTSHPGNP